MQKIDDVLDRIGRQGQAAWKRLKKDKTFEDWKIVGQAVVEGRNWAMQRAGKNQPIGSAYNRLMAEWLARYGLDDMDRAARSRLIEMMVNLPAIQEWRKTLTQSERLQYNHPNTVVRRWKANTEIPEGKQRAARPDKVAILTEDREELEREVRELRAQVQDASFERLDPSRSDDVIRIVHLLVQAEKHFKGGQVFTGPDTDELPFSVKESERLIRWLSDFVKTHKKVVKIAKDPTA